MRTWLTRKKKDTFFDQLEKTIEVNKKISAYDMLEKAILLKEGIEKMSERLGLPHVVVVGVLMEEIVDRCTQPQQLRTRDAFMALSKYIDKNCMKKEPLREEEKYHV